MVAQIKEFRFDQDAWRIDCLGGVIYPGTQRSPPLVETFLSKLATDQSHGESPLHNGALHPLRQHKAVAVDSGLISLLRMGSVWVDGVPVPPSKTPRSETFVLHSNQLSFVRFDGSVEIDGTYQKILTPERYRLGDLASARAAGGWLAVALNPTRNCALLAIPCTTLFQKCAATSTKAVGPLLLGDINKIIDPSWGRMADSQNTIYVEMFKDFRSSEAKAIANLLVDPVGQREYARLRHALTAGSSNQNPNSLRQSSAIPIKFGLPFSHPVELQVQGKHIKFRIQKGSSTVERWGFLVSEITTLKTRLVFDKIVVGRKNDSKQGRNSDDDELREGWSAPAPASVELTALHLPIDSALEPSKDLEALCIEAAGDFKAEGLIVEDREKEVQKYKKRQRIGSDGSTFTGDGATGDPRGTGSGIVEVNLEPLQAPKAPVTLEEFFETLHSLQRQGFAFQPIQAAERFWTSPNGSVVVNYWPRKIARCHSWHLLTEAKSRAPRAYVVAELRRGGVWHYLIEVERKGTPMSLQHVRSHDGRAISKQELQDFMMRVAIAKGWSARESRRNWIFTRVNHPSTDRIQGLTKAIISVL